MMYFDAKYGNSFELFESKGKNVISIKFVMCLMNSNTHTHGA